MNCTAQATGAAAAALFDKCALKVAKVLTVGELANSEKLFKLSIDVGNGETKQVSTADRPTARKHCQWHSCGSQLVVQLELMCLLALPHPNRCALV